MRVTAEERARWERAAYYHDALRDAPLELLTELSLGRWHAPKLLHGPAAAEMARLHGERDQGVLDAVIYHTVGYAGWDAAGRMLYLADYLEPGRSDRAEERRAWADRVPEDPEAVLRDVARERLTWTITSGSALLPETVEFWNALV